MKKQPKFAVLIIIISMMGVYLSFFSPYAVGSNSAIKEEPVKPAPIIVNSPKQVKSTESEPKVGLTETNLEALKNTLVSSKEDTSKKIVSDNVPVKQIMTIITGQPQTQTLIAQITQPTSRGTSSQKQTVVKAPIERPLPAQETKAVTIPIQPEAPKSKAEITADTNKKEPVNSQLFKEDLNSYVLDMIKTYELGKYPYLLNTDYTNYNGVTTNITYQGSTIAKANPSGDRASHCVGITFEVFFKAMQERNKKLGISPDDFNGMSGDDLRNFMLNWFVSDGIKPQQNCSVAVAKYGIGKRISNFEDAKAGDFIDISRENNTGHTAVFLNWIKKDGKIVGLKYWGSQNSTKGIAYKEEYFNVADANGTKLGNVMFNQVYIARVGAVEDYK